MPIAESLATRWATVCPVGRVPRGGGVAAYLDDRQVAVLRTDDDRWFAVDNRDPFTGAHVLARGIVGDHGGVPTVASPLRKQRFDLTSGACIDAPDVVVATHAVRVVDDHVQVRLTC